MLALAVCGCDAYDDSQLWKSIVESYKSLYSFKGAIDALEGETGMILAVVNNGVITSVEPCATGGYTIGYKDASGAAHSIVVASQAELPSGPVVGVKENADGEMCWVLTSGGQTDFIYDNDGSTIPVSGRIPEFGIDATGYWTINGSYIIDANGNKVMSEGKTSSVIKDVQVGMSDIILTLADGSTVSLPYSGEKLRVMDGSKEVTGEYVISDETTKKELTLSVPANARVKIFECKNLTATLASDGKSLTVSFGSSFERGSLTLMLLGNDGSSTPHPVFFITESGMNRFRGTLEDNDYFQD